ncbi:hypothetical protein Mal15_03780 [Stieleria maiorica]|uniref:Uncharacterized protein n=1 Tax=Stieleria maiorica TaxID=2795974 RepID=A0A5B9M5G2_9BACT|nr:hypothetical protein Mal15_03780 [Stieleria maiorica]
MPNWGPITAVVLTRMWMLIARNIIPTVSPRHGPRALQQV